MDERELIERCKAGDEVAWARLYERFAPIVQRFLERMLSHSEEHDDLVQQVFVEALVALRRFRGDSSLATWLYGIASRVALHHLRRTRRTRRRVEAMTVVAHTAGEAGVDLARQVEARADLRTVASAAQQLPADVMAVWVMRELEGLSTSEVAQALGIREGTVRSRLFTAREQILAAIPSSPATEPPRVRRHDTSDDGARAAAAPDPGQPAKRVRVVS